MNVAQEILEQFGGNRAMAMIGGAVIMGKKHLTIKFHGCKKSNIVTIVLNEAMDLYEMTFYKLCGVNLKEVEKIEQVCAENVRGIFESKTGLYLSL